jgi:hypothetical protein
METEDLEEEPSMENQGNNDANAEDETESESESESDTDLALKKKDKVVANGEQSEAKAKEESRIPNSSASGCKDKQVAKESEYKTNKASPKPGSSPLSRMPSKKKGGVLSNPRTGRAPNSKRPRSPSVPSSSNVPQDHTQPKAFKPRRPLIASTSKTGVEQDVIVHIKLSGERIITPGVTFVAKNNPHSSKSQKLHNKPTSASKGSRSLPLSSRGYRSPSTSKPNYKVPDSSDELELEGSPGNKPEVASAASAPTAAAVADPKRTGARATVFLGDDGNKFFCQICSQTGNVVCCDGCPNVYHPTCLADGPSKQALDMDDDPWFCPDCFERRRKKKQQQPQKSHGGRGMVLPTRKTNKQKKESSPSSASGGVPGTISSASSTSNKRKRNPTAWATMMPGSKVIKPSLAPGAKNQKVPVDRRDDGEKKEKKTRKKKETPATTTPPTATSKKKKSTKESSPKSVSATKKQRTPAKRTSSRVAEKSTSPGTSRCRKRIPPTCAPTKPISPFFLFLQDSMATIIRQRLRKNYLFRALPSGGGASGGGYARNKLIAQEGAILWARLKDAEKEHYRSESTKDFDERKREWKQHCQVKGMSASTGSTSGGSTSLNNVLNGGDEEGENNGDGQGVGVDGYHAVKKRTPPKATMLTKPKSRRDGGANPILLEVLQDHRFHPVPMLHPNRQREEFGFVDYSKVTVPCFEIQGPSSTSLGDDCMGCIRGWRHFCPVLKRQFPAVEHRAKLQPPLSSMLATRIGVGLLPEEDEKTLSPTRRRSSDNMMMGGGFGSFVTPAILEERRQLLNQDTSEALDQPHSRFDDIFEFVEDCVSLKASSKKKGPDFLGAESKEALSSTNVLPAGKTNATEVRTDDGTGIRSRVYKCQCGRIMHSNHGCIPCRRSLLVNFFARKKAPSRSFQPDEEDELDSASLLKLQTAMVPRVLKNNHGDGFDKQKNGDRAIAAVLIGEDWKPNVIMPSHAHNASHHQAQGAPSLSGRTPRGGGCESHRSDNATSSVDTAQTMDPPPPPPKVIARPRPTPVNAPSSPPSRRKLRSAAGGKKEKGFTEHDRTAILQAHKDKEVEIQRKTTTVAIAGIFLGLVQRDPQRLFAEPMPQSMTEYHKVILHPMDFKTIRRKILDNDYKTNLQTFVYDVRLLGANALSFNPPETIYADTAKYLLDSLEAMLKRATEWLLTIKNTHKNSFHSSGVNMELGDDPFADLRISWPGAVELMEEVDWFRSQVKADFVRTKENEGAYYGNLAIRRAAAAAAFPMSGVRTGGIFKPCVLRSAAEDEQLRCAIEARVAQLSKPLRSLDEPGWREQTLLKLLRKVQSRRVEKRIASISGCARCDGVSIEEEAKLAMTIEAKKKDVKNSTGVVKPRVDKSRLAESTGLGSEANMSIVSKGILEDGCSAEAFSTAARTKAVGVRGSGIHGWGLFADQPLQKGEVVAEYVGEYVVNSVCDAREKMYEERRIQDYQFRVSHNLVIDATLKGGHARYINHSCDPNCIARKIFGDPPKKHLKKVIVFAERNIAAMEEITYDYQFPLVHDLDDRIPCNCSSSLCRGFMNWDLPEKGSSARESNVDIKRKMSITIGKISSAGKRSKKSVDHKAES